ncbi:MAG: CHASE2 domain-containing protein [Alphaproteobacteria bacterium]
MIFGRLRGGATKDRFLGGLLLLGLLAIRVWDPGPVELARVRVFDLYQRLDPREAPTEAVVVVDVDDASLAAYGQWPWPRTLIARLVANLFQAGAVAIGFDMIFAEPDRLSPEVLAERLAGLDEATRRRLRAMPGNDDVLAGVIAEHAVILGRAARPGGGDAEVRTGLRLPALVQRGPDPRPHVFKFSALVRNRPALEAAASGHGVLTLSPEVDGVVRRVPALVAIGEDLHPALSLEVLRVAAEEPALSVETDEAGVDAVRIGRVRIPTDNNARIWVHFARLDPGRYVSAADVLRASASVERVAGRTVLVGTSAVGLLDIKAIPLGGAVPGVEIHAQIVDMVSSGRFLSRPNFALGAELVATLLAGLLVVLLVPALGSLWTLVFGAAFAVALTAGSWQLYASRDLLIDATYPAAASFVVYAVLSYLKYVREEGGRRRVRSAFGQYLAPSLVDQLAAHPERLALGGETREMSFLFCDVRGFTSISEAFKGDPQGLTSLINRLLTPLTRVILAERGTIDKYIGDCIMAFWNAPIEDPDHAANACRAALAMTGELARLNEERRKDAAAAGETFLPLRVGIGINTGACVVGNMGSEQRFDYSVLGDAVNLAARLEGLSKNYGVDIVVGPETAERVAHGFALLELDLIAVKGKREAVRICGLLGGAELRDDPEFRRLVEHNGAMLAAYRGRDWDRAEGCLALCRDNRHAVAELCQLYARRIEDYRERPPAPDWDGAHVATEK